MFYIVFHMLSRTYSGKTTIPSPGKVLGALLSSAYDISDTDVINAVRSLAQCPPSTIIASEIPTPYNTSLLGYQSVNRATIDATHAPTIPGLRIEIGKMARDITTRRMLNHDKAFFAYKVEGDNAPPQHLVQQACEAVCYLGKGHDTALAYTTTEHIHGLRFTPAPEGTRTPIGYMLRTWSQSLLDYYDTAHHVTTVKARSIYVDGTNVQERCWLPAAHPLKEGTYSWLPIPTPRRLTQRRAPEVLQAITYEGKTPTQHPIVTIDTQGWVQGVLAPYDKNSIPTYDPNNTLLRPERPLLTTHSVHTWDNGEATHWISATPLIGHPDPHVVIWELEQEGYLVQRLERKPFHPSQGGITTTIIAPQPYSTWWAELTGIPAQGIRTVGRYTHLGAGLLRPIT